MRKREKMLHIPATSSLKFLTFVISEQRVDKVTMGMRCAYFYFRPNILSNIAAGCRQL